MVSRRESVEIEIFGPKLSENELVVAVEVTLPSFELFPAERIPKPELPGVRANRLRCPA
jgi:hypothetical protein